MGFLTNLDHDVGEWFNGHRTKVLTGIMRDVTALGGYSVISFIILFTLGLLLALRRRLTAMFVLIAVVGGALIVEIVKSMVGRERPEITDPELRVLLPGNASFPSGHSMVSAVVYLTLALLVVGRLQGHRIKIYLISCSLLVTLLIGISRLYLGVHFFSDVVAGWVGGLGWALTCRWIEDHSLAIREKSVQVDEGTEPVATPSPT